jgi:hypothetical protein
MWCVFLDMWYYIFYFYAPVSSFSTQVQYPHDNVQVGGTNATEDPESGSKGSALCKVSSFFPLFWPFSYAILFSYAIFWMEHGPSTEDMNIGSNTVVKEAATTCAQISASFNHLVSPSNVSSGSRQCDPPSISNINTTMMHLFYHILPFLFSHEDVIHFPFFCMQVNAFQRLRNEVAQWTSHHLHSDC